MFRPSVRALSGLPPVPNLLCRLLTSACASLHLLMSVAQGTHADLPGYCAPTFTLMPVGSTSQPSVQLLGFDDIGHLTRLRRLISASCSSGQRFAFGFLQIRSRPQHPCRSANSSPCRASRGLSPPSECALPGAPIKTPARRCIVAALSRIHTSCPLKRHHMAHFSADAYPFAERMVVVARDEGEAGEGIVIRFPSNSGFPVWNLTF